MNKLNLNTEELFDAITDINNQLREIKKTAIYLGYENTKVDHYLDDVREILGQVETLLLKTDDE